MLVVHNTLQFNKQLKHLKAKRKYCGYFIASKTKWRNCAKILLKQTLIYQERNKIR